MDRVFQSRAKYTIVITTVLFSGHKLSTYVLIEYEILMFYKLLITANIIRYLYDV